MSKIECKPKTIGDVLADKLDSMGKHYNMSINSPTRVSITITEPLTQGEKESLLNGMPAWLKGQWEINIHE